MFRGAIDTGKCCAAIPNPARRTIARAISAEISIELDVVRIAVGRTDLSVGPITPTIIAQQQQTASAFQDLGLILKPILIREVVWSPPGG